MNAYLYFSGTKIKKLNDEERVKSNIANAVKEIFDLSDTLEKENIKLSCVKISNGYDLYFVVDVVLPVEASELVERNNKLKNAICNIIQQDQKKCVDYNIGTKFDSNYKHIIVRERKGKNEEDTMKNNDSISELDYEKRSKVYVPVEPSYTFDRVILPNDTLEKIEEALNTLKYEKKVFEEWGLYEIQPRPSSSLSFFGPSGTGKTMAAEAIADKLGKKILKVSYADVESKYHGEGPKMVKAIFLAAEREEAVLFFDEADSLLSKRLTNVSQGSDQAINSMRSQLLICLEEFRGIVIFATNLLVNYDQAFLTRLINVEFINPDVETRKKIWDVHIKASNNKASQLNIPLSADVDTRKLAMNYPFVGREIRNAVISTCISVAMQDREVVRQSDFENACNKILKEKESVEKAKDYTISDKGKEKIKDAIVQKMKEGDVKHVSATVE